MLSSRYKFLQFILSVGLPTTVILCELNISSANQYFQNQTQSCKIQNINNMEKPLSIFIVGTTAVGKTKLSLHLCKAFNGEVVSCDSKQLYRHASILTAKATLQQQKQARHHMIDCLQLFEATYNRNKYFLQATEAIRKIQANNKVSVIVGGTNYYLQTLLFNIDIDTQQIQKKQIYNTTEKEQIQIKQQSLKQYPQQFKYKKEFQQIETLTKDQKYQRLKLVDEKMAEKLHPNDEVRITSFLEKYYITGVKPSDSYKPYTHQLRKSQTILFWVRNSNKEEHKQLVKKRIKEMLEKQGIIEILSVFTYLKNNNIVDCGISQTIGYKEFQPLFESINAQISHEVKDIKSYEQIHKRLSQIYQKLQIDKKILNNCQDLLTKNTLAYVKRQITWIKNRLFSQKHTDNFFILDISQNGIQQKSLQQRFYDYVLQRSEQIVKVITTKGFGSVKQSQYNFIGKKQQNLKQWKKYHCEICNQEVNGKFEWEQHLQSGKHAKNQKKIKKMEKKMFMKAAQKQRQEKEHNKSQQKQQN